MKKYPDIEDAADRIYQEVASDLPKHGDFHWQGATGHLADRLYDLFNKTQPDAPFQIIARRVVNGYAENDTQLSKRREKAQQKAREKALLPPKSRKRKQQPPAPSGWDVGPPKRRGIGSW